jgi:pyruvate dehydrogenase phosphatase regulatory subunit
MVENCSVEEVLTKNGAISGVLTNKGHIQCEKFVNSAGKWARKLGHLSTPRVEVPMYTAEHYYLHTKPVIHVRPSTPVVHDPDAHIYFREDEGRFLIGGFEPVAKPQDIEDLPTVKGRGEGRGRDLAVDWDHFHILLEGVLHRVPAMGGAILEKLTNGPEPFAPDGNWILGKAPEVQNYFVAAAMRSIGVGAAGGVAEVISSYILDDKLPFDTHNLDIQRFLPIHNNRKFLRDRVREVPGLYYAIPYPFKDFRTARALRTSPIFPKLREAGARFGQIMGYERAMYFETEKEPVDMSAFGLTSQGITGLDQPKEDSLPRHTDGGDVHPHTESFFKPHWFNAVQEEFKATRDNVSIIDYSSFAKFDIFSAGSEAVDFLQYMCSNDIDVPIGTIVNTGMHNVDGGYENDCSVARLAYNRFMLMSPSIQQMRSKTWIMHHLPKDGSVYLQDVTSLYTTLCISGPKSPDLLAKLSEIEINEKTFPHFTCRHLDIGCAPDILTMSMTHTGELGYVMYIPSEFSLHVLDELQEEGSSLGVKHCGYYAMHAVRIEKFFALWGQDLDSQSTPYECGRAFRVKLESTNPASRNKDFIGRDAFIRQKKEGIKKILIMLLLDAADHNLEVDPWPWGGEPIFRDGVYAGRVTTAAYGFTLGRHVCLGFVHNYDHETREQRVVDSSWVNNGLYEVEIGGLRYSADVKLNTPVLPPVQDKQKSGTRHE